MGRDAACSRRFANLAASGCKGAELGDGALRVV
eukprot:CAMPEP_0171794842 /NCGR_PEP_ID=MMETSP0991-20121206/68385_1 /TAXON_ID=483369 /ORGANISM="non described non described, Strain CCMP2098" /LENGTH=32 /DNA_ID= /DNA_START= /DNA_END= /DNA_ORIENTATION=